MIFSYYRLAGNVDPYLETRPEVGIRPHIGHSPRQIEDRHAQSLSAGLFGFSKAVRRQVGGDILSSQWLNLESKFLSLHFFRLVLQSKDARIQPEAVKRLIALEREAGNIKEDVDVSQVTDLYLFEEVQRQFPAR